MNHWHYFTRTASSDKWSALADPFSLERMCLLLNPKASDFVVDVGTGRGSAALAIAGHVDRVLTFDISDQSAHMRAAGRPNVEFRCADLAQGVIPHDDGSADIVICRAALYHLDKRDAFYNDAFRVLRPGGRLYIMDPVMSPELRLAWSVFSRITERDYRGYATEDELLGGITAAGFNLQYAGGFLFPRNLRQLLDERMGTQDAGADPTECNFNDHVKKSVWHIVHDLFPEQLQTELHLQRNPDEGWFAYNCMEVLAVKGSQAHNE